MISNMPYKMVIKKLLHSIYIKCKVYLTMIIASHGTPKQNTTKITPINPMSGFCDTNQRPLCCEISLQKFQLM